MMRARQDEPQALQVQGVAADRARRVPRTAALSGWLLLALACGPDAEGKFGEFLDDTKDDRDMPSPKEDFAAAAGDINGEFLLAVSTTVNPPTPLQFIATNTVTKDEDGKLSLSSSLQPLSLALSQVTMPRQPIGDPLVFTDVPIIDGKFTIDAGTVSVTGEANPITAMNIVASLIMSGSIMGDDFYCGSVTGNVMQPPVGSIEGSSFAAVRLTDKTKLPTDVMINCGGDTVTDP